MNIDELIPPSEEQFLEAKQRKALQDEEQEYKHLKQNKMEIGKFTSTVKRIESVKDWNGGNGVIYFHNLEMDNGHKINSGKKKKLSEGDTLSYEVVEVGQEEYSKTKPWNPEYDKPNNDKSSFVKKSGGQNASFALSYAKDLVCATGLPSGSNPTPDVIANQVFDIADKFLIWLNENSK